VDLVVLDLMLPDMSGYEVCARLRRPDAAPIPVLMLTAMGRQDQVVRGLELGADDYLVKPFDPHELVLRVAGLLRRSKAALTAERERAAWQTEISQTRATADAAHADAVAARSDAAVERVLRGELLHNVTTHMRTLGNVADVTVRRFPDGPLREVAEQLRQRIRSAATLYEVSEALQQEQVELGEVVRIVTRGLKTVYRPSRRVMAEVTGPPLTLSSTLASPLALICTELVTNSFRHAFPGNRFGTVSVSYAAAGRDIVLHVVDNGVGFDVAAPQSGRGRRTVAALTRELGGTVTWTSGGGGTRVSVQLPLRPGAAAPAAGPPDAAATG
jgi:DNA-binding response OmpR family regulator/anti-sigma regulatory factor (Ser/Thr protein kinase)